MIHVLDLIGKWIVPDDAGYTETKETTAKAIMAIEAMHENKESQVK